MKNKILFLTLILISVTRPFVFSQSQCAIPTAQAELEINNVRTTILVGGDMWWDLVNPKYEIPKGSGKHSLFAGSLWIGGIDDGGQIKVAAQTYRQTGADFWGGPLDTTNTTITQDKCRQYDKLWKITKTDVMNFIENPAAATNDIKNWPGNGDASAHESQYLAPFYDANGDGYYNYADGDYPGYSFTGNYPTVPGYNKSICNDYIFGDQTIWWVFNDVGNIHTSSGSDPIGLEIRAQAFSFKTNDEINNMTFYKYQIINRSTFKLNDTYFGQWVDPDLGNATDDYVGCDVIRGLGFCYNGDTDDETANGYGLNPPAVGIDFFQGPVADLDDLLDNDRDGCIDCTFIEDTNGVVVAVPDEVFGEQIIMSKFVYYDNVLQSPIGNPATATDFYNYLRGFWLDNQQITFGGNGRDITAPVTSYMFPGTTDPAFPGQNWTEVSAGNTPGDRRLLQSAGTFTLEPGAVNYVTTGIVWARASQGGLLASVDLVKLADDKAQALFDNCFKLIDGPNAPDLAIRELDNRLIFSIQNYHNEMVELYSQEDPTIVGVDDSLKKFNFQGYQVYQLRDATVTTADIGDADKVRLLFQCDIKDGTAQIVNFNYDPQLNANVPVEMVNGADNGIVHTFEVRQDLFATGNTKLVNHRTYYYTIVSYAFNEYKKYDPNDPAALDGQKKPYLAGRNNIKTYSAIPHNWSPENAGQILGSDYGLGPRIRRIEGQGNGGMILDFVSDYTQELTTPPYRISNPEYRNNRGPLKVRVYDPTLVRDYMYETRFNGVSDVSGWSILNLTTSAAVSSERYLSVVNEQVIPEWGLTATFNHVIEAGKPGAVNNAFLDASITYADPAKAWMNPLSDIDDTSPTPNPEDWIRSGAGGLYNGLDDEQVYEKIIGGTWAPYKLTAKDYPGPKWSGIAEAQIALSPAGVSKTAIAGVDIIITADKSKWSRAAVIETGTTGTIGGAATYGLRLSPSVGKDGLPGDNTISATGMSWFPGYAVNVETGERLNIAFGENSLLGDENGTDMKWNPTSNKFLPGVQPPDPAFGGMHYIYVFGHNADNPTADVPMYDSCRFINERLATLNNTDKRNVWKDAMWVSIPMVKPEFDKPVYSLPENIPSDVKIRLRVARSYRTYATSAIIKNNQPLTPGTTYYVVSTPVTHNGLTYNVVNTSFVAATTLFTGAGTVTTSPPVNGFNPMYTFGTGDLANTTQNASAARKALDLINVVPNPYYAFSSYETSQLDNRIKITNLPPRCTISIFTMSGTLVRKFGRDVQDDNSEGAVVNLTSVNNETSVDWDLKNHVGIPVASGVYLIHVDAGSLGKRTLKWFGMLRPIDLDTF